ncbi:hypothetical protein DEO72_LG9g985 [Vigna unguiculata]|uniref:Uncharacterized protein n=1 Tax=Vigna unguiculata TaxID=3917 RepID=A0A4D6MWX0_VIGUN|nr:hypothetical protein DEO72_LG9g985 [Vigna unguiculata]
MNESEDGDKVLEEMRKRGYGVDEGTGVIGHYPLMFFPYSIINAHCSTALEHHLK